MIDPRQLQLLPDCVFHIDPILLECRLPPWGGKGRRPTRPRLFLVGDKRGLRVRGPRVGRRLGQCYRCTSVTLVEVEGREPFWVASGVVLLHGDGPSPSPAPPAARSAA